MNVNPIPEGYTSLTPFLVIDGAAEAIEFYVSVFGAKLVEKMAGSNGLIAHAELDGLGGAEAIEFYVSVFRAKLVEKMAGNTET